jgi:hypothetical protein
MTLAAVLLLLAAPAPSSLDQVKAEPNPEHRARLAIDYAAVAERRIEDAYSSGDAAKFQAAVKDTLDSITLARDSFTASGKKPNHSPGPYKYAEQRSHELLVRLNDLSRKMDDPEREPLDGAKMQIQEIHDAWFEGIMSKGK